jgi:hypothetical protein
MTNNFAKNDAICDFEVSICFESNNQLKDGSCFVFDEMFVLIHHHLESNAHFILIGLSESNASCLL